MLILLSFSPKKRPLSRGYVGEGWGEGRCAVPSSQPSPDISVGRRGFLRMLLLIWVACPGLASQIEFSSRELFRLPFGTSKQALGVKVEGGNLLIPRDFSLDAQGHFYITDTHKHRIMRVSSSGAYEMGIVYPPSAEQVFAQPDGQGNLWLLISDPRQGFYYGVYDQKGKRLREGVFAQYNRFRLHVDDAHVLHVILSNTKTPQDASFYYLDQETYLLNKVKVARPPEEHHQVNHLAKSYFIDPVPAGSVSDADRKMRITNEKREEVGTLRGRVVYVTDQGEIYTRVADCDLEIYSVEGARLGKVRLDALPAACASARFDGQGNIYVLDGVPNAAGEYAADMSGLRLNVWERR